LHAGLFGPIWRKLSQIHVEEWTLHPRLLLKLNQKVSGFVSNDAGWQADSRQILERDQPNTASQVHMNLGLLAANFPNEVCNAAAGSGRTALATRPIGMPMRSPAYRQNACLAARTMHRCENIGLLLVRLSDGPGAESSDASAAARACHNRSVDKKYAEQSKCAPDSKLSTVAPTRSNSDSNWSEWNGPNVQ
jgi:hypothetical protein